MDPFLAAKAVIDDLQINTWVSGDVSEAVLLTTNWRWGIGMWCIIYTVCSIPLLLSLMWASFKAKKAGALDSYSTPYQVHGAKNLLAALFWQLDVPGIILLIAVFGCILTVRTCPPTKRISANSDSRLQSLVAINHSGTQLRSSHRSLLASSVYLCLLSGSAKLRIP